MLWDNARGALNPLIQQGALGQRPRSRFSLDMSPTRRAMLMAGLGILANPYDAPGQQLAKGALSGLGAYDQAKGAQAKQQSLANIASQFKDPRARALVSGGYVKPGVSLEKGRAGGYKLEKRSIPGGKVQDYRVHQDGREEPVGIPYSRYRPREDKTRIPGSIPQRSAGDYIKADPKGGLLPEGVRNKLSVKVAADAEKILKKNPGLSADQALQQATDGVMKNVKTKSPWYWFDSAEYTPGGTPDPLGIR